MFFSINYVILIIWFGQKVYLLICREYIADELKQFDEILHMDLFEKNATTKAGSAKTCVSAEAQLLLDESLQRAQEYRLKEHYNDA